MRTIFGALFILSSTLQAQPPPVFPVCNVNVSQTLPAP